MGARISLGEWTLSRQNIQGSIVPANELVSKCKIPGCSLKMIHSGIVGEADANQAKKVSKILVCLGAQF